MKSFGLSVGDREQSFFIELLSSVKDLAQLPKLAFVFKRTAKVGLLFEGDRMYAGDLLDAEEIESGDISIYEAVGAIRNRYSEELRELFKAEFPKMLEHDFILHRGVNTCLIACPPLDIYTHGYEEETVEAVFKFFIARVFELLDNGVRRTDSQTSFFNRHIKAWRKAGGGAFIKFKTIS
jgi:hypothetical protein